MKSTFLITLAAATLLLASCSNDETEPADNRPVELRLTSGVEVPQTRSTQETSIAVGEVVSVWIDNASTTPNPTPLHEAVQFKAGDNGTLSAEDNTKMYFPSASTKLNIYAIHGNFTTPFSAANKSFPSSAITHTVASDQKPDANNRMSNYLKSDLLYAVQKDVTTSDNVNDHVKTQLLTFYHLLSKVEVALKAGTGVSSLDDAIVTIEGTKLKADFKPNKNAVMADDEPKSVTNTRATMVTPTGNGNDPASITIQTVTTDEFGVSTPYAEAIVVPQKITQNTTFIKVKLSGSNTELVYKITDTDGLTLESGKKYTFNITVNLTELTVTSTIKSWEAAGDFPKDGTAVMP